MKIITIIIFCISITVVNSEFQSNNKCSPPIIKNALKKHKNITQIIESTNITQKALINWIKKISTIKLNKTVSFRQIEEPTCKDFTKVDDYLDKIAMSFSGKLSSFIIDRLDDLLVSVLDSLDETICGGWNEIVMRKFYVFEQDGSPYILQKCPYVDWGISYTENCRGIYFPVSGWRPFNEFDSWYSLNYDLKIPKCSLKSDSFVGEIARNSLKTFVDVLMKMILKVISDVVTYAFSVDEVIETYLAIKCYEDQTLIEKYDKWCGKDVSIKKIESISDMISNYLTSSKVIKRVATRIVPYVGAIDDFIYRITQRLKGHICKAHLSLPQTSRSAVRAMLGNFTFAQFIDDLLFNSLKKTFVGNK